MSRAFLFKLLGTVFSEYEMNKNTTNCINMLMSHKKEG
jgi:hypothetical protein